MATLTSPRDLVQCLFQLTKVLIFLTQINCTVAAITMLVMVEIEESHDRNANISLICENIWTRSWEIWQRRNNLLVKSILWTTSTNNAAFSRNQPPAKEEDLITMLSIECVIQSPADLKPLLKRSFSRWGAGLAWNYAGRGRQKNLLLYLRLHRCLAQQQQETSSEELPLMNSDKSPQWPAMPHNSAKHFLLTKILRTPPHWNFWQTLNVKGSTASWWADQGNLCLMFVPTVCPYDLERMIPSSLLHIKPSLLHIKPGRCVRWWR